MELKKLRLLLRRRLIAGGTLSVTPAGGVNRLPDPNDSVNNLAIST